METHVEYVFAMVEKLFEGDEDAAQRWMNCPQPALGGVTPQERAKTKEGVLEVKNLIGRLEHGVFS